MKSKKTTKDQLSVETIDRWIDEHIPNYHLFPFYLRQKIRAAIRNNFEDIIEGRKAIQEIVRPYKDRLD